MLPVPLAGLPVPLCRHRPAFLAQFPAALLLIAVAGQVDDGGRRLRPAALLARPL